MFRHDEAYAVNYLVQPSGFLEIKETTGRIQSHILKGPAASRFGDLVQASVNLPGFEHPEIGWKQQITFWLGLYPSTSGALTVEGGESLLSLPPNTTITSFTIQGLTKRVLIIKNTSNGTLAGLALQLDADNAIAAEDVAHALCGTLLSAVSYQYRLPIHVDRVEVVDMGSQPPRLYVTRPRPFSPELVDLSKLRVPGALQDSRAWNRAMANYRDSLLLELPMYRFLALYKALEDLDATLVELNTVRERNKIRPEVGNLPDDPFFRQYFPDLAGKPVRQAASHIRAEYRHAVAHTVLDDRKTYVTSHSRFGVVDYWILCTFADTVFRNKAQATLEACADGQ